MGAAPILGSWPDLARGALATWDPNGAAAGVAGSGSWDGTLANWFDGTNWVAWDNAAPSQAVFLAPAGTVTLNGGSINASAGIALASGYTLENGTLNVSNGSIVASSGVNSFKTNLAGTGTLALSTSNGAVIELLNSNSFSGTMTVNSGTVRVGAGEALNSGAATYVNDGAPSAQPDQDHRDCVRAQRFSEKNVHDSRSGTSTATDAGFMGGSRVDAAERRILPANLSQVNDYLCLRHPPKTQAIRVREPALIVPRAIAQAKELSQSVARDC